MVVVRFYHDVVASSVPVGACLAVAGYAGVYYAVVDFGYCIVVHGVLCEGAGKIVFDEYVTFFDEAMEDVHASWVLEGQTQRSFVAVYAQIVCALSGTFLIVGVLGVWWSPCSRVIWSER
jgi:hypothetical protein